jgi:hypothetical protein
MISNDPIEQALGLRPLEEALKDVSENDPADEPDDLPVPIEETNTEVATVDPATDPTIQDIELARLNIKNIIEKGDESLNEMIELAKQSESPRAFEVASGLMKTLLDANKDFVEMSMKKKYAKEEIMNPKEEQAAANVTNNNLILSTTDLLKMLKGETE